MARAARGGAKAHDQGSEDKAFHGVVKEKIYHLDVTGRILAVDVGARRVGLAISDVSRTLARPLETIAVSGEADAVERVARRIAQLNSDEDALAMIVVGLPTSLDGAPTPQTARVTTFIARLAKRTPLPIATEDERLTSREAESRLAVRQKDWRKRKAQIDAVAAAVFLQDFLDRT
jgi:putative holliday junction resolvase